jgi:hypothetical protein
MSKYETVEEANAAIEQLESDIQIKDTTIKGLKNTVAFQATAIQDHVVTFNSVIHTIAMKMRNLKNTANLSRMGEGEKADFDSVKQSVDQAHTLGLIDLVHAMKAPPKNGMPPTTVGSITTPVSTDDIEINVKTVLPKPDPLPVDNANEPDSATPSPETVLRASDEAEQQPPEKAGADETEPEKHSDTE